MGWCSGLLGQVMGWVTGCRLWDIGVSRVSCVLCRVVVSWLADRQRRDTIPCLPRYACSRHPHQNPHPYSTRPSINQSISQSARPSFAQSVGRGGSSRIVSGGRLSPPRSAPQPQVSTRWPGPPIVAALLCCRLAALLQLRRRRRLRLGRGRWAGAARTRAEWTIPGRDRGGLFTDPVFNELVVRGGDDR